MVVFCKTNVRCMRIDHRQEAHIPYSTHVSFKLITFLNFWRSSLFVNNPYVLAFGNAKTTVSSVFQPRMPDVRALIIRVGLIFLTHSCFLATNNILVLFVETIFHEKPIGVSLWYCREILFLSFVCP